eukprot:5559277-Alexandrium_andersonii.AAC.1
MGLLEVVPEPPKHTTYSSGGPSNTEYVNIKTHLNMNTAPNTDFKHPQNFSTSGKRPPSSR